MPAALSAASLAKTAACSSPLTTTVRVVFRLPPELASCVSSLIPSVCSFVRIFFSRVFAVTCDAGLIKLFRHPAAAPGQSYRAYIGAADLRCSFYSSSILNSKPRLF
jgi:hypothetical protein